MTHSLIIEAWYLCSIKLAQIKYRVVLSQSVVPGLFLALLSTKLKNVFGRMFLLAFSFTKKLKTYLGKQVKEKSNKANNDSACVYYHKLTDTGYFPSNLNKKVKKFVQRLVQVSKLRLHCSHWKLGIRLT